MKSEKSNQKPLKVDKINPLPLSQTGVIKIIKIEDGNSNTWFTGDLPYFRKFTEEYTIRNHNNGDMLDKLILESIKEEFPLSSLKLSKEILLEGDIEKVMAKLPKGSEMSVSVTISPKITEEEATFLMDKEFQHYEYNFKLYLLFSEQEKKQPRMPYFSFHISHELIDNLANSIVPI